MDTRLEKNWDLGHLWVGHIGLEILADKGGDQGKKI